MIRDQGTCNLVILEHRDSNELYNGVDSVWAQRWRKTKAKRGAI